MANITVDMRFAEREEYGYSFMIMSDVLQKKNWLKDEQLPKVVADIKRELLTQLKEYMEILPLFASEAYQLSLFTNCRRLFVSAEQNLFICTEDIIKKVFVNDSEEMTARVFMTADNNEHEMDFYRQLVKEGIEAVKYCLQMDVPDNLRTLLLSMLVDKEEYTKKIIAFALKTLTVLRQVFKKYQVAVTKAYSFINNTDIITENLVSFGIINERDELVITPILLNPCILKTYDCEGIKYAAIGIEYEQYVMNSAYALPTVDFEAIGKIFADPTRCEIIRILKNGSSFLSELARKLQVPPNSLHYHIQMLNENQVIKGHYKGKKFIYELNPRFFQLIKNTVQQFI